MKLIDLLVRELPKRGGWPDGAVECCRHNGTNSIDFYDANENWNDDCYVIYGKDFAKDAIYEENEYKLQSITRDQYEAALTASKKVEWDGVGFPAVGVECEWQDKNTKQWQPVTVVYTSEWVTVVREINKEKGDDLVEVAIENYGDESRRKFRPLRTEAYKKRDEAAKGLIEYLDKETDIDNVFSIKDVIGFYDAIAAGKIHGVKLGD